LRTTESVMPSMLRRGQGVPIEEGSGAGQNREYAYCRRENVETAPEGVPAKESHHELPTSAYDRRAVGVALLCVQCRQPNRLRI
jgi:hypothetical protein